MSSDRELKLEESWKQLVGDEFQKPYLTELRQFLLSEKKRHKHIYPPGEQIFAALDLTPVDRVKIVVIGQDPYHGPGQAHGLCFSVPNGVAPPPSLVNIYREINDDIGASESIDTHNGCLVNWARQGVLLLNAVLTVEKGRANSHRGRGWEQFTDTIVNQLNIHKQNLVFMLWGSYAQKKGAIVDRDTHCVLTAPHPSPLSAHRGFFGCRHFSKANEYLRQKNIEPVDWCAIGA